MSILNLLRSRSRTEYDSAQAEARLALTRLFPPDQWGLTFDVTTYTEANLESIWKHEIRRQLRSALTDAKKSLVDFTAWLPELRHITVVVYSKSVFPDYKDNVGWRIMVLCLPAANVIAIGLASHYQGGQRHNRLAEVSNLLNDVLSDGLRSRGYLEPICGRKVNPDDWEKDGLITDPATVVAGVTLALLPEPQQLFLKDVRTTTEKKILASFITIEPLPPGITEEGLATKLGQLRDIAASLASHVYPFTTVNEFEALRSIALQDLAAATLRLQLRKTSATRSVVRIYYGPPGTGKTLTAVRDAVKLVDPIFDDLGNPKASFSRFNELDKQLAFLTFHQSMQYEDVVESIRPSLSIGADSAGESEAEDLERPVERETRALEYRVHEGIFLRMIRRAALSPEKDFVIVIDEINRGDISRILGPLISSLEPDKRVGADFPIGIELQYPRASELESRLFVPTNLHILGTMNSADRNIALVDHALRRRFEFTHCPPNAGVLGRTTDPEPIDLPKLLNALNRRIEHLLGADHCIGHGYFMGCSVNSDVVAVFARKIIPLLNEYFHGRAGLVLLIVGDRPGGNWNIFQLSEHESNFEALFSIEQDIATQLGYRVHEVQQYISIDSRFWDSTRGIPGPGDERYASRAIMKIYDQIADDAPGNNPS